MTNTLSAVARLCADPVVARDILAEARRHLKRGELAIAHKLIDDVAAALEARLLVPQTSYLYALPTVRLPLADDANAGVGVLLRDLRKQCGFSQTTVATAIGMERTSVTNIEGGKQSLALGLLPRYAAALGCDVFLTLKGKPA